MLQMCKTRVNGGLPVVATIALQTAVLHAIAMSTPHRFAAFAHLDPTP
jgi:hypothetical protein